MPGDMLFSKAQAALAAGLKLLQYRDKTSDHIRREQEALALLQLCKQHSARLIVNDDVELAARIQADGVHLGLQDEKIEHARAMLGASAIIGATCHNKLQHAEAAVKQGASYVAFGRFYPSQTKATAQAADLSILTQARQKITIPVVGIGGITANNVSAIWDAGAHSAAVCHGLFSAADPAAAFKQFANIYENRYE